MKVICTQENLRIGLQTVSRIISSSSTLPVLNNVLLKTENGQLKLAATNLEIGINTVIRCKIEEEGEVCLQAKTLLELVNNLPNQNITLASEKNQISLSTENYSTKLKDFPAEEFPLIPQIEDTAVVKMSSAEIKAIIDSVIFAASTSETQPEISGICLGLQDKLLTVAATDRYRLAENKVPGSYNSHQPVIIPHRAALEISRVLSNRSGDVELFLTDNQVAVKIDDTEIISRLIDGQYPEYSHIVPKEFNTTLTLTKTDLVAAVKTTGIFSQGTGSITLEYNAGNQELSISAISHDLGESRAKLPATVEGEDGTVLLNYRYMLDFLNSVSGDTIVIRILNDSAAVIFQEAEKPDYIYLIMPIKN